MSETQILLLCLLIIGVIAFIVKSIKNHQDDDYDPPYYGGCQNYEYNSIYANMYIMFNTNYNVYEIHY